MLGFEKATGELVGFSDADGSTPPGAFQDLVENIGDAGAIIASRWCRGADVSPRQPFLRRACSRVFNLLTRIIFGLRLTDTQCGAKLMKREAVMQVLPSLGITRWAFDVDLLFQLRKTGYKIVEIPTIWHDVAGSKIELAGVSVEMFAALVRLRLLHSPFRWLVTLYNKYLGPFIHPPGLEHDHLFRHSLLLITGGQVANALNLLFQIIMVRMLSDAHYGVMAAMLGIFMIVNMSLGAFRWTVAHFSARFVQEGNPDKVKAMVISVTRDLSLVGLPLVVALVAGSQRLAAFFNLETSAPIIVMSVALIAILYIPVLWGALNGVQAFAWISAIGISWSLMRLVFAVACVAMGYAAIGALSAHALAALLALVLCVVALRHVLGPGIPRVERAKGVYPYFFRYMMVLGGFAVLGNMDVLLVKHYFESVEAGLFAKAAMIARIVIFLPQPVVVAMFPKVVSSGGTSYGSWRTLLKALALVAFMIVGAALVCTLFPQFVLWIFGCHRSPGLVAVLRGMVWALSPVSIIFVLMNFELAQGRFVVTIPLILCAVGYIAGVALWHDSVLQVVSVLAVASASAAVLTAACVPWRSLKKG